MGRKLPPLKMLQTLEAVVRLRGISAAAKDLGVTHGAVSKQIALLEEWLGRALFDREHRRFRPFEETTEFAIAIASCFDQLEGATGRLNSARCPLKVLAHASFAMHWLVPRLEQFYARNPDVDVHVQTRQTGEDPWPSSFDVAIMRGDGKLGNWESFRLIQEHITLLTTPARAAALAENGIEGLIGETLAVSDTRPNEMEQWLKVAHLPPLPRWRQRRFGHFHTALMAVLNGQGVAVGPIELSGGKITDELLAAPFPLITVPGPYHTAFVDTAAATYPIARRFALWVQEATSAD